MDVGKDFRLTRIRNVVVSKGENVCDADIGGCQAVLYVYQRTSDTRARTQGRSVPTKLK